MWYLYWLSFKTMCSSTQKIQVRVWMRLPGNGLMWGLAGSLWTEARRAPRRLATHLRCWRKLCLLARLCSGSAPLGPTAPKRTAVTSSATSGQQTLHTPVMVKEVLESLDVQPGQVSALTLSLSLHLFRDFLSALSHVLSFALPFLPLCLPNGFGEKK